MSARRTCEPVCSARFSTPRGSSPRGAGPRSFHGATMKAGRSLIGLALELERQRQSKKDLLVPFSLVRYSTEEGGASRVLIDEPGGSTTYGISELARRQLADKLRIPYAYFDRMRLEQPEL